jgi:hypothetical protein
MLNMKKLALAILLILPSAALAQNTTTPPLNMINSEGGGANKIPLSSGTATSPVAWGVITGLLTAGTNITLTPSGTNQVTIASTAGAPGGSTNDLQYKSGASTFGGITLTDGQLAVGQTSAAPLAKTLSGDCTLAASGALSCSQLSTAFVAFTGPASSVKTFTLPNASSTILTSNAAVTVAQGGTGATTLSSGNPLFGNGTSAISAGTVAGTGTVVGTVDKGGGWVNGDCLQINASGNIVDAGGACTTGGGGGTVASATIGQLAIYTGATTVSGLTKGNNQVAITNGSGAISFAALPLANMATQTANTILANATAGSAAPTAIAAPSCSTSTSALIYTTSTGLGCNVFGTVVTQNTGTSGANVPLLNGGNTYSGSANFTSTFQIGSNTMTFPSTADTLAGLGTAQTFTAVQTFANSDLKLKGSSTGVTTFTSDNSGSSNFTLHFPAVNDTLAVLGTNQVFTASQRVTLQTITISTATFTPNFDTGADFSISLSSACPCTVANPSTTPVAGQHGVIYVKQDGTGSRTIGTWGSQYFAAGGVTTLALSTGASAVDVFSYAVEDATHIIVTTAALNISH